MNPNDEAIVRTKSANILIIDDDLGMGYTLARMAQDEGHRTHSVPNLAEGLPLSLSGDFDVVFLDVRLPDGNGIDIIPRIQSIAFPPEIIIITAFSDKDGAQTALKSGVWDYIEKPARISALKLSLKRALQYRSQKKRLNTPLVAERAGIIGSSSKLLMCLALMTQAARCDANVLICGETGTGKELFAKAIHLNSGRTTAPFVVVDCAALPEHLADSMLFGHVKGAFTGAEKSNLGLIKKANGGTLFLDEVGELPAHLQKTFLRVLQEKRFRPVGSNEEEQSDFRLVSATHRNLEADVDAGGYRQDLFFRLRTLVIELPALRERIKDIKEMAIYHVSRFCQRAKMPPKIVSDAFLEALMQYPWPGNVRELVNALESATAMESGCPTLYPKHIPEHIRSHLLARTSRISEEAAYPGPATAETFPTLKRYRNAAIARAERHYLTDLLRYSRGEISKACRVSGLQRARLYQLMKKYRIRR